MDGQGVLTWRDGKRYEGQFVNDKREGHGVFVWADGRKYIGSWKAGKQHGIGTYISKEGLQRIKSIINQKVIQLLMIEPKKQKSFS